MCIYIYTCCICVVYQIYIYISQVFWGILTDDGYSTFNLLKAEFVYFAKDGKSYATDTPRVCGESPVLKNPSFFVGSSYNIVCWQVICPKHWIVKCKTGL